MEDLPLGRTAALVPKFAVKDLPLDRTLWWWWCWWWCKNQILLAMPDITSLEPTLAVIFGVPSGPSQLPWWYQRQNSSTVQHTSKHFPSWHCPPLTTWMYWLDLQGASKKFGEGCLNWIATLRMYARLCMVLQRHGENWHTAWTACDRQCKPTAASWTW